MFAVRQKRQNRPAESWRYLFGLKSVREERGFSVRKLAEKAGTSPDTVHRLETLKRMAWADTARALAEALGVEVRDLSEQPEKSVMRT